jgi:acyl-CoA thioester hydrolase
MLRSIRVPDGVTCTTHRVRVAYADTDQGGVVHHSVYLRYLESARIEHMRERGFDYRKFEIDTKRGLFVVEANVSYLRGARFDDDLEICTWIGLANRAKLRFDSIIARGQEDLTHSEISLACVRFAEAKISSMPAEVIALADPQLRNKR